MMVADKNQLHNVRVYLDGEVIQATSVEVKYDLIEEPIYSIDSNTPVSSTSKMSKVRVIFDIADGTKIIVDKVDVKKQDSIFCYYIYSKDRIYPSDVDYGSWGNQDSWTQGPAMVAQPEINVSSLARSLPGVNQAANYPCGCHADFTEPIFDIIIHLNDDVQWSREQIADWLETLDIDLSFQTEGVD